MAASDIRAKLLKFNPFRSKIVTVSVPDPDGGAPSELTVKVKQPSVRERNAIFSEQKVSKDGTISAGVSQLFALAVVHCVRDPDSDEPLFTAADLDVLMGNPSGSWVDQLAREALSLLEEAKSAGGESPATPAS